MRRQNFFDQIGPLDQADALTKNIFIKSDLLHLFNVTDPVNIKMIKRYPSLVICLHNSKCRTADRFCNTQSGRKALGENSLADTKIAYQTENIPRLGLPAHLFTYFICFFRTKCFYLHTLTLLLLF